MPIDPRFETRRERLDDDEVAALEDAGCGDLADDVDVWGPIDPPVSQGIHGTHVAVDFDICVADGACLEDCPVDVFTWVETPDHPESDRKVEPTREDQCIDCMLCVDICPVDAIDVDPGRENRV